MISMVVNHTFSLNGVTDSSFSNQALWHEIADLFAKDACALMGLSIESPLAVAVNAGCTALPALLNIKQVGALVEIRVDVKCVHLS